MKHGLTFKPVLTWCRVERKARLFRLFYNRRHVPREWCSWCLSVTLRPRLFQLQRSHREFYLTVLCLGLHWRMSSGGYEV